MEVIDQLVGYSNDGIRRTECAADKNALGTIENDPVEGELWFFFVGVKIIFDLYVLLSWAKQKR